ncbi:MAG TPA: TonB-dependent receptor [Saprospiraceae bacterium]|nr:TonB-dependent receptor [Saprospiraceae bacterium]
MIRKNVGKIIFLMMITTQWVFAQQRTITGKVTDDSGEALIGANISVQGTTRGSITDIDGMYTIQAAPSEVLIFTYLGYQEQSRLVGDITVINVTLLEDATTLDEVIVVAFGTVKKEQFVGSAAQIKAEDIEGRAITNITQALEGTAPGVQVSPGSGQPGSGPNIRVRGVGSISSSNAPLYVVDGVVFTGNLASLNPADIESMTVLKDAASTSLYGAGASNGVVMITTKRGKKGTKDRVTFNVNHGFTGRSVPEYERVGPEDYYVLMWEALRNAKVTSGTEMGLANDQASAEIYGLLGYNPFSVGNDQVVLPNGRMNPAAQLRYGSLDWQEELFKVGSRSNADLSIQGANDKTDYFISLGYLNEEAFVINSDFERFTTRISANSRVKDWFKTGLNIAGSFADSRQAVDGAASSTSFVNPFRTTRVIGSIYPVFLHDPMTGQMLRDDNGNPIFDHGDILEIRAAGASPGRHPIQENLLNVDRDKVFNLNTRTYAEISFLTNFKFTTNLGFDRRYYNNERLQNAIIGDAAPSGRAFRTNTVTTGINFNQLLEYNNNFGKHNLGVLIGHESLNFEFNSLTGTRQDQIIEGNTELINFVNITNLNSFTRELRREGYFSRLNYNWDNKYFISASLRRDGSSRFAPEVRWGNFWSVGGAWRVIEEGWFDNVSWLNDLKLRASYGQVGNDSNLSHAALSFFAYQPLASLGFNNAAEAGAVLSSAGNRDLTWESNNQFDIAVEFSLFKNRISGVVEYYWRESDGLIFDVPLPVSSGLDNVSQNIGAMFNRGFEFFINADIVRSKDFSWNLNLNAATITNRITKLPQDEIISGTKKLVEGGDIFAYWLRSWYGVDPADGAALYIPTPEAIEIGGADIREVNGTLVTTNQNNGEFNFHGTALPDLYGGIGNSFRYKRFTLNFLLTYQIGGLTYDSNWAQLMDSGDYGRALSTDALRRWQQPGDVTDVPRMDASTRPQFNAASSRWLVGSDFLAFRQIGLTFNVPASTAKSWGMEGLRFNVNAENLFAMTQRVGLEPAQNFNGTTQNRFTPARIISAGANVIF